MLYLVSGISSLFLFVNVILVPVLPFPTHLFLHPSLLPLLIHHSVHLFLHLSFTPGLNLPLKPTSFTLNPTPVILLLPPGLPPRTFSWTVSSELLGFILFFPNFFVFKLAILSAFERTLIYRIVSYRMVPLATPMRVKAAAAAVGLRA